MKIFLGVCLFLAIFSEVIARECNVRKPNGETSTCTTTEGGDCFFRFTVSNFDGPAEVEMERGCTTDCTTENYSFTAENDTHLRNLRGCCRGMDCYDKVFNKPKRKANGQECPTCFPLFSKACNGSKTIKCKNDETQCIEFVVAHDDTTIPDKDFHGCAAPKFCELAKMSMHSNALGGTITQARCSETVPPLEQLNVEGQ